MRIALFSECAALSKTDCFSFSAYFPVFSFSTFLLQVGQQPDHKLSKTHIICYSRYKRLIINQALNEGLDIELDKPYWWFKASQWLQVRLQVKLCERKTLFDQFCHSLLFSSVLWKHKFSITLLLINIHSVCQHRCPPKGMELRRTNSSSPSGS